MSRENAQRLLASLTALACVQNASIVVLSMPSLRKTKPPQAWYAVAYDYHPKHLAEPEKRIDVVGTLPEQYHKKHRIGGNWESRYKYSIDGTPYYVACYIQEPIAEQFQQYHPAGGSFSLFARNRPLDAWETPCESVVCSLTPDQEA